MCRMCVCVSVCAGAEATSGSSWREEWGPPGPVCIWWGPQGMGTRNVAKVPPAGAHGRGRGLRASGWLEPTVTGTEATAPEGRALAWGLWDCRIGRCRAVEGSGVGAALQAPGLGCSGASQWGWHVLGEVRRVCLAEAVVGQALWGSWQCLGAGMSCRVPCGGGGHRGPRCCLEPQGDELGGTDSCWLGLGGEAGDGENWGTQQYPQVGGRGGPRHPAAESWGVTLGFGALGLGGEPCWVPSSCHSPIPALQGPH